jgi:6-phosphogluconate dehydrogenase
MLKLEYKYLCESLGCPKVFVFSLPHGTVGDSVLGGLMPYLEKNDIIIDAANEHWTNTERRQGKCATKGIRYIGMGVSGGYQAARAGPSMCPGGDDESLDMVMPLLEMVAAKDKNGTPCVGKAGMGGAGHYVKMIHNGIEHGMMSAIAEAWQVMDIGLGMSFDEIGDILAKWNEDGPLVRSLALSSIILPNNHPCSVEPF